MKTEENSVDFRMTPELVTAIQGELARAGRDLWETSYSEIQDDARGVYVTVDLLREVNEETLEDYKSAITALVGNRLPTRIDRKFAWMVIIKSNGPIVDSIDAISYAYGH